MNHLEKQKVQSEKVYSCGSRSHVLSKDVTTRYIVSWRIKESIKRLMSASKGFLNCDSNILVLCSGEGMEGSILCDMGFADVTVSDLAEQGVQAALERDSRLKGLVLNAESTELKEDSFDIVLVQDGLHHLQSPIQGFTEMLRVAKKGVIFLEPHDSLVGRMIGTKWEKNGSAINYVFRWNRKLVEQVISSYLGPDRFENLSFSFWHHNPVYAKIAQRLGSSLGLFTVKAVKLLLDMTMGKFGNQFCGLILKR
jgi:ubiquinone/menaquinone biosynthesis C-methylase UbiE